MYSHYPRHALVVGIDSYPQGKLSYCVNDAISLAGLLTEKEYEFQVQQLLDQDVTKDSLRAGLEDLFSLDSSFYLFYYSGHGFHSKFENYFVTPEIDNLKNGLPLGYINNLFKFVDPMVPIVIILDCCHSGKFEFEEDGWESTITQKHIFEEFQSSIRGNRVLMASCLGNQESKAISTNAHSLFSYYLLEGLAGKSVDIDGKVRISRLFADIERELSKQGQQTPLFKGNTLSGIEIGKEFPASIAKADSEILKKIPEYELKSSQILMEITDFIEPLQKDTELWANSGYLFASEHLPDRIKWFIDKQQNPLYSELKRSKLFSGNERAALNVRLQVAESIWPEVNTSRGQIKKLLGQGGFGKVWLIENENGKKCAYKVCHAHIFHEKGKLGQFIIGREAMQKLEHNNIVKVELGDATEIPLGFYMEYVDGPDLRELAPIYCLNFEQIIEWLITIARTLKFAHNHPSHILHRDIKPENILVRYKNNEPYEPVIADFDLAWYSFLTTSSAASGLSQANTIKYASPEFRDHPERDDARLPTTDVYSFGQLLYFFITNSDPDPYGENQHLLAKKCEENCPIPDAALEILRLYKECTAIAVSNRIQSMEIVLQKLITIRGLFNLENLKIDGNFFVNQLLYQVQGFKDIVYNKLQQVSLATKSRRFIIDIETRSPSSNSISLIYRCIAQDNLIVLGKTDYKQAKVLLYEKLGKTLRPLCNLGVLDIRRDTSSLSFSTMINHEHVPLTWAGIEEATQILKAIMSTLDKA